MRNQMSRYQQIYDQKKQHGLFAARELSKQSNRSITTSSPLLFTATLNIDPHPYILSLIIDHSTPSTLSTLLRCSKYLFQAASPRLYRNLHLSQAEFTNLIDAGHAPLKRGASSGLLGRGFSPYLREALHWVKTLYITDYRADWIIPQIPRGAFDQLDQVVLLREPSCRDWKSLSIPTDLLNRLNKDIKKVTLLIVDAWRMECTRRCVRKLEEVTKSGKSVSIVLLPFDDDEYEIDQTGWRDMEDFKLQTSSLWRNDSISITGNEYIYTKSDLDDDTSQGSNRTVVESDQGEGQTFIEWLEEGEAAKLFTEEEEGLLRINDAEIWKSRNIDRMIMGHLIRSYPPWLRRRQ